MNTQYRKTSRAVSCLAALLLQGALLSTYAGDAAENRGQLSAADYKFAKAAACGGMTEVNLGRIAAEKSANVAVQQFGQHMVMDHGKAGQDLQALAARKGATLPSEPSAAQQKEIDRLNKLSGAAFDKAYVALMVKDHKADEKEFKKAAANVQDPDLRAFAATTLTVVQGHLKMAEDLEQGVKHNNISMNR